MDVGNERLMGERDVSVGVGCFDLNGRYGMRFDIYMARRREKEGHRAMRDVRGRRLAAGGSGYRGERDSPSLAVVFEADVSSGVHAENSVAGEFVKNDKGDDVGLVKECALNAISAEGGHRVALSVLKADGSGQFAHDIAKSSSSVEGVYMHTIGRGACVIEGAYRGG